MTPANRISDIIAAHLALRESESRHLGKCLPRMEPPEAFKRPYSVGIKRLAETPSKAELDYLRGISCPKP